MSEEVGIDILPGFGEDADTRRVQPCVHMVFIPKRMLPSARNVFSSNKPPIPKSSNDRLNRSPALTISLAVKVIGFIFKQRQYYLVKMNERKAGNNFGGRRRC
jgi:hypothetical protein